MTASVPTEFTPTDREREVIYGYANGLTDREIAKVLGIKLGNAARIGYLMRLRMGAYTRSHAVALAYELGILTVGGAK